MVWWAKNLTELIPNSTSDDEKEADLEKSNRLRDCVRLQMAGLPIFERQTWDATTPFEKIQALKRLHELIFKTLKIAQGGKKEWQKPPLPSTDALDSPWLEAIVVDRMKSQEEKHRFGMKRHEEATGIILQQDAIDIILHQEAMDIILQLQAKQSKLGNKDLWEEARIFCKELQRPEMVEYRQFWKPIVELHLNLTVEKVANWPLGNL